LPAKALTDASALPGVAITANCHRRSLGLSMLTLPNRVAGKPSGRVLGEVLERLL